MSQLSIELSENFPGERIPEWEHNHVHEQCALAELLPEVVVNGTLQRLPRATYFSETASIERVGQVYAALTQKLKRPVHMAFTHKDGTHVWGLELVAPLKLSSLIAAPPARGMAALFLSGLGTESTMSLAGLKNLTALSSAPTPPVPYVPISFKS